LIQESNVGKPDIIANDPPSTGLQTTVKGKQEMKKKE